MGAVFKFKKRYLLLFLSILLIWVFFPLIFKFAMSWMTMTDSNVIAFGNYGPIGDIYGSLNTLVSSIALCAVAISTVLQVTSLKETRRANREQFLLTKEAHDEQIRESRNAIFANQFYSLLDFKKEKFNNISLECFVQVKSNGDKTANALTAMQRLLTEFISSLHNNPNLYDDKTEDEVIRDFFLVCRRLFKSPVSPIISYLFMYKNLISLINESDLEPKQKALYFDIMCNSMFQEEQMLLFWIAPLYPDLKRSIDGSFIFNQIYFKKNLKKYGLKFHVKKSFRVKEWVDAFEQDEKSKTQP